MKLPLPYISQSQFWLFNNDPEEYYQQYYVARRQQPTKKMIFGSIFQEAWCDKAYNYKKKLRQAGFTPDYERVIKTALEHPNTLRLPKSQTEKRFKVQGMGLKHPILAILDGFDKANKHIIENKMGIVWNQQRVDEATQVTWYALSCYLEFGFIPRLTLQSFNSRNGQVAVIKTKRTKEDFKFLIEAINDMHDRIIAGDFQEA